MGNIWTRLSQEAAKHGGPDGLRTFYQQAGKLQGHLQGQRQGIWIGGAAVGAVWLGFEVKSAVETIRAQRVNLPAKGKPTYAASGTEEEASKENKPDADAQEDPHG